MGGEASRRDRLRGFMQQLVGRQVGDAERLISSQLIESISAIQIVVFVETAFGLAVDDADLTLANFDSIDAIVALLEARLDRAG